MQQMREQDIVRLGLLSRMCDSLSSHAHFDEVGGASVEEERHEDEVVRLVCVFLSKPGVCCVIGGGW